MVVGGESSNSTVTSINRSKSARTFSSSGSSGSGSGSRDVRRGSLPFVETLNLLTRDQLEDEVLLKYMFYS